MNSRRRFPPATRRLVLVTGLWKYEDVEEKKSLGKLNVTRNVELREKLLSLVGADSVYALGYRDQARVLPLLRAAEVQTEPTLASVALRSLVPPECRMIELSITELLDMTDADVAAWREAGPGDDVCLLSTSYITCFRDLETVLDRVRRLGCELVIAGGYLATRNAVECVERGVDVVIIGDAEEALPRLLTSGEDDWADIPNLYYQDASGSPVHTAAELMDLDAIPVALPDGDLSSMAIPYESMRGCPYHCAFCSYPLVSTVWRYKSAEKLIADFRTIQERGAQHIIALDSTFTIPPKRLRQFLDLYLENDLSIPWGAYSRTTALKNEVTVEKLAKANNRWMSVGFESGSDAMLVAMKKGTTVSEGRRTLANLRKHRVAPWSNFIVGFPGETEDTVMETVRFMTDHLFGFYGIYVFNIRDREMPVLSDSFANVHFDGIGGEWTHVTMDSQRASVLRWDAYVGVAANNPEAINIDVFRGTNVEKDYSAWSMAFPALKAIELYMLWHIDQPALEGAGSCTYDDIVGSLKHHLQPLRADA